MIYELAHNFWHTVANNGFKDNRDAINELTKYLKRASPDTKRLVVVTKHKYGAWWLETVIADSCTYHFRDYGFWRADMTDEEAEQTIKKLFVEQTG